MSDLRYFDLSITAPRRLALMRKDFNEFNMQFPHCPEHAKPITWRNVRAYRFDNYAATFGLSSIGKDSDGKILSTFVPDSLPVRKLRDVHDVASRIRHTGWYCDDDQSSLCIGIVASLPHAKFLAGYRLTDSGQHVLQLENIFDDESDAADYADGIAESHAETERDYQERFREALRIEDDIAADLESLAAARQAFRNAIEDRYMTRHYAEAWRYAIKGQSVAAASFAINAIHTADRAADRVAQARAQTSELIERIRDNREKRERIEV